MKTLIKLFVILIFLGAGTVFYAFRVEPFMLSEQTINIQSEKIGADTTVVIFSDTHIKEAYSEDRLVKIVDKINAQNPDVVLFLGDLFDSFRTYGGDHDKIVAELSRLSSPTKLCVYGNHDYGGGAKKEYANVMSESGFDILVNDSFLHDNGIAFVGYDDFTFGTPPAESIVHDDFYNLAMAHAPDTIATLSGYDFFVAGHSHGGQVTLPFIKPFILPEGAKLYSRGLYKNEGEGPIFVTRGIGTSIYSARLFSVPEIVICKFSKKTVEK